MIGIGAMPFTSDPLVNAVMCSAIQDPGTFYWMRSSDSSTGSGATFSASQAAWGQCDSGDDPQSNDGYTIFVVPLASSMIGASISGSGEGEFSLYDGGTPPVLLKDAQGSSIAVSISTTAQSFKLVNSAATPDICDVVTSFDGSPSDVGPFPVCCPVLISVSFAFGNGTDWTISVSGAPDQSLSLTLSLTPEGP